VGQDETGKRAVRPQIRLTTAALGVGPAPHHPTIRGGDRRRRKEPKAALSGTTMELILTSIAGTMTLFVVQFMEFVDREHAAQLASRIRAIPWLLRDSETLTAAVSVVAAYGR